MLQESFLNRAEREGRFEELLEKNKDKINELTDIRQELDLDLLKVKFSGRYVLVHAFSLTAGMLGFGWGDAGRAYESLI